MAAELTPVQTRAQDLAFVTQCSLDGLRDCLPLRWPTPLDTPPSPKKRYRSRYVYPSPGSGQALGWEDLEDPAAWEYLSDFDLLLRLVDFDPLRSVPSASSGQAWPDCWAGPPPVVKCPSTPSPSSCSQAGRSPTNGIGLKPCATVRLSSRRSLRKPRHADYAQRFGFENGIFPTEGGLRYWLTTIGQNSTSEETVLVDEEGQIEVAIQRLNQLLVQSVALFVEADLLSPEALKKALY